MEMLKLFSEAKANGLSKEEFFHLLELELKMNESKKQASGGIMSSGDGLGSGAAGLEQLLRETCEKIENQQKQMLALQNELQKHNLQGKSELSRGAEGRFDSALLDMKDKFHEMRNTVLNRLEEEKSFMREALSKAHNDIPTLLSKTGQEVNQIKEVLGADEIAQIGKQVSQIRLLCEEQGQQKGPQDNKDDRPDGSASSQSAGAFDDMEEVKSGYHKPKPQGSTEGAPNLKAFFDQLFESEDVKAKMKAQEAKKEAREKKEREEQERLRKSAGAFDDMEEVKSGYQKPKPQASTEGAPNLKAFFDQLFESEDVKAKMKAQEERERREAREKKEREEQERLRKSAGAFDDMEEVKSGYQKPKPQASTEGAPNLKAFFDQLGVSEDVKAKMKAQEERERREAREKKEREEQERLRKSAGAFDDMEEVKSGYQKPKPQASTEGAPNLKAFFDQLFESEDVKAKMKAQEERERREAREKKEREEQERLRKSAGAFDDMEEVKSGYQKPKPQASTEGAPNLKAFFDQLGVSEDVKAKMKAQEERERREAREKKEREEQERLRKSAGAFDDMEEVKSGYQKPKPQASTEGAPNLKAFFDQLGVSEDVKAKMKAQEERERREAREKKEREEQERLRKVDVGWWRGQCRGVTGVFPANYVELQQ